MFSNSGNDDDDCLLLLLLLLLPRQKSVDADPVHTTLWSHWARWFACFSKRTEWKWQQRFGGCNKTRNILKSVSFRFGSGFLNGHLFSRCFVKREPIIIYHAILRFQGKRNYMKLFSCFYLRRYDESPRDYQSCCCCSCCCYFDTFMTFSFFGRMLD